MAVDGQVAETKQTQPAETPVDAGKTEAVKADAPKGAPEKYEFKAPEGRSFDNEVISSFSEIAKRRQAEQGIREQEERFRQMRLSFFLELQKREGFQAVLLAHHADDAAETVLKRVLVEIEGEVLRVSRECEACGLGMVRNGQALISMNPSRDRK
jgi:hypothetical protein